MLIMLIVLIVISCLINMFADYLLVSGKKNDDKMETIKNTPDDHIIMSGMLGFVALTFWMGVIYFLSYIDGNIGQIAMLNWVVYITAITVFHVICSYTFLLAKHSSMTESELTRIFSFYMVMCILTSMAYTGTMMYLGLSGLLKMNIFHYLTLPFFSTIIFQFGLGKIIKLKHFSSISGTLSMLISMLSTIHVISVNFGLFMN